MRTVFNLSPEQDWRYSYVRRQPSVLAPPAKFGIDPWYTKFTWAREFTVLGRGASDEALLAANGAIRRMFAYRHDVLKALMADGVKLVVLGRNEKLADLAEVRSVQGREGIRRVVADAGVPAGDEASRGRRGERAVGSAGSGRGGQPGDPGAGGDQRGRRVLQVWVESFPVSGGVGRTECVSRLEKAERIDGRWRGPYSTGSGGARRRRAPAGCANCGDEASARLGGPLPVLSMGMSGDLEVAIEEGATLVRVGTALFGARPRSPGTGGADAD